MIVLILHFLFISFAAYKICYPNDSHEVMTKVKKKKNSRKLRENKHL